MNLFRKFGLPVLLTLVCAIGVFAQIQEAIRSDRLPADKSLPDTKLFDYYTPLEDYLVSGNPDQVINASTYAFSPQSTVALEDMSSGTTQLVAASQDDTASAVTNIGFEFWFDGVRFTQFSVNANGLVRLGGTAITTAFDNANATTGFATTTNAPKIAPFFEDLCTGTNGKVHYKVTGSAPNRKLVVEWQNMQVTRGAGCAGAGAGTFQLWINESAAAVNPGAIQFVYGSGIVASATADAGASIGLQSGAATNFASVTAASDSVSYSTHDALNAAGIAAGESFAFTPVVPNAPTGLSFSNVSVLSQQLNWTDNASNETGYAIYRSTDGTNYSFVAQTAADATSYNDTGLLPNTNYFYRVYAVSEGALSSALAGSQATGTPTTISCNGAGGNWSDTAAWAGGAVPTAANNVTITSGCTITVDTTTAVAMNVTIDNGGTLQSPTTGTVTNNNLTVGGNLTNNGTLDFSTNGDTSGAILTFGSAIPNVTFGGSGAVTDVRAITVAKGAQSSTVDLTATNFTVLGVNTDTAGFLTITSGTFKVSGSFTMTNRVFTAAGYTIPALGGFWLNNPNFTVAGQNGSPTLSGLLRMTQGTLNIGTSTGNSMGFAAGSTVIVEGGAVNATGRFGVSAAANAINYNQSGGTITVQTVGNTSTTLAGFDLGTSTGSTISMTGGTIIVQVANTAASGPRDYRNQSGSTGTTTVTGGTLQLGNAASPAAQAYDIAGVVPNLTIDNTSAGHSATFLAPVGFNNVTRNVLLNSGTTLNIGSNVFLFNGTTFTNNGTLIANGASSNFVFFLTTAPVLYTGTGTVTAPVTNLAFQADMGTTIDAGSTGIVANAVRLFSGNIIGANKLTVGNGGTTTATVQIGNTTTPTAAGTFDSTPTFNPGSGGIVFSYLRTGGSRTIGPEMAPTRTITTLTYDDNAPGRTLTLTGGNLTVTNTLALTNGVIVTDASNILKSNGTTTRSTGYVDGPLARDIAVTGTYTYHVGDNGYSPVAVNTTAGTGSLTIQAIDTAQPNIPNPAKALSRYWKLNGSGITSDLTFNYLDPDDVPATANEANFVIVKYDGSFTQPGGTVNPAANTASITGVTSFSDWTLAEPSALTAPGTLALSSSTYSANENAGTVAVTVNRTGGTDGAVTVDYALSGGTATGGASCAAGIDYVNTSGTVSFANGEASKSFNVTLCGDTDVEPDETFNVTLSNATGGATIGSPSSAVVTILNDDAAPTGPVTVTATAGTASATYTNLTLAIAAVNDGTHQGDIVISINESLPEPGTIVLNGSGAGAAVYTSVLIRPTVDDLTVSGASATGRGLLELNGADNVTIDGDNPNSAGINRNLTFQNTAANTVAFTSVIRIALAASVASADGNTFKNLNILGNATGRNISTATSTTASENTVFGIFSGPGATGATTAPAAVTSVSTGAAAGTTATNLVISNNSVTTAARAVSINAAAATIYPGLQITNNTIGNLTAGNADQVTAVGITASGSADGVISGNTVWVEGYVAASAAGHGIAVGVNGAFGSFTIEKNKVNRVQNNNPATWSAYGINLGGSSNHVVQNNFVSGVINNQTAGTGGFGTTFGAYGIRVGGGTGHKIYHNSVNLYGAMPGVTSTNLTAALLVAATGQTGMDVRNNIFSNQITGGNPTGTRNVSIYLPSGGTSAMNLTLNNNAYFAGLDANNRLAQVGATFGAGEYQVGNFDPTATTPATNFRAYTSTLSAAGTNDNASFASTAPPPFVSNVDLHIPAGTATRLESGGAAVGVTVDIDNDTRNATTPDIGADEFAGNPAPANDIAAVAFVFPTNGSTIPTGASFSPVARFNNNGTATQTNVTVRFRIIDSSSTVIYNQTATIASIAPLQNVDVTFPSTTINTPGTYTMEASAELAGDANPGNNTITGTFNTIAPVGGTVTVGAGGTYPSLTNPGGLFAALNLAGISGNLTVNITSDLTGETGAVALNQLAEAGAGGYTVTIKPSGGARVISGSSATNNGLINLNGADRIVFDGSLSGGTDRSLTITNTQTGTSTVFWIKSVNAANGANNNTIKNTIINGAGTTTAQTTAGILAGSGTTIGGPAEAPNNNNTITNNWIYRVQNSLYNQGNTGFDQNWTITNNEFGSATEADKNRFRGMLMGNANNFTISGNTVLGVGNFDGTTGALSGIQLAFAVTNGTVTNNRISNVKNLSAGGTGAFGMQLSAAPTTNILIANNFIWDIQAVGSTTVTSNGHGITINGAATAGGYKIYHNSINLNTNQTSGTTAALNIASAVVAAGAIDVRNNIFANTQTSGATRYAVYSAAAASVFSSIDYNDYFAQNVGFLGTARPTLADWQTATGQDTNSLAVDPLFVSPTDLHLQATSPVLGEGVGGLGVTTDIDGQTRDNPPDIGADEVAAAATPGTVQFGSATYTVGEAGGTVTLTVTRTGGSNGAISVAYVTANGTATGGASCGAGVDYVTANGTLNWADGDAASKTFNVTICNDALFEGNETFTATLSGATGGATIGTPNPATVTITDDDPAPTGTITVSDVRVNEGNTGGANAVFTVTYTGSNPASASVNYATASGTALAGVDFVAVSGTLNFASSNTQTVTVPIIGKAVKEANEVFYLNLSGAVNATIADGQGVGIIVDEDRAYVSDFDRDLYSDVSVFRPSNGGWYILNSSNATPNILTFGSASDRPVPGDYDGDGKADVAIFRASEGKWYVILSTTASVQITNWGAPGDKAVQGDYDGDGKTDFAVFRPSTGSWWILRSSDSGSYTVPFGVSTDKPMQGDYDGDFKTDVAVYRNGTWYITFSSTNTVGVQNFGVASDLPVSGDFDGDGKYDLAVFRPSIGDWFVYNSLTGTASQVHWGANGDVPVPADYDRDGTTDLAIFRPSTGEWYVLRSSNNSYFSVQWGLDGDIPVPAAYIAQ